MMFNKKPNIHKETIEALRAYANGDMSVVSRVHKVYVEPQKKSERRREFNLFGWLFTVERQRRRA